MRKTIAAIISAAALIWAFNAVADTGLVWRCVPNGNCGYYPTYYK
jgi:hypothetical protein